MTVGAAGIEQPGQADHLRRLKIATRSGHLFSRPVAPDRVEALLHGPGGTTLREIPDQGFRPAADTDPRSDSTMETTL
jgi:hypothetical protein